MLLWQDDFISVADYLLSKTYMLGNRQIENASVTLAPRLVNKTEPKKDQNTQYDNGQQT